MTSEARPSKESAPIFPKTLLVASPLGFCAGVVRSVGEYERMIDKKPGRKIYSVGEPAHNNNVNRRFSDQGVIFVDSVLQVPSDGIALLGPHGSSTDELELAKKRGLEHIDTVCPLVQKVHDEIDGEIAQGFTIVYFGKKGHAETIGVLSHDKQGGRIILVESLEDLESIEIPDPEKVAFNSQTTHAVDKVQEIQKRALHKWPKMKVPNYSDVCYATQNRQDAVRAIIEKGAGAVVILGSEHSSNAQELKMVAEENGTRAFFVDEAAELNRENFLGIECVGLSAAASVDREDVEDAKRFFQENFGAEIKTVAVADESRIRFARPKPQSPQSS